MKNTRPSPMAMETCEMCWPWWLHASFPLFTSKAKILSVESGDALAAPRLLGGILGALGGGAVEQAVLVGDVAPLRFLVRARAGTVKVWTILPVAASNWTHFSSMSMNKASSLAAMLPGSRAGVDARRGARRDSPLPRACVPL